MSGAVANGPAADAEAPGGGGPVGSGPVHRAVSAHLAAVRAQSAGRAPHVLDVGGGSGSWAVPLARQGCAVTVVDSSPDALASLARRARNAGVPSLVTPVLGDVDALADAVPDGAADLVLGHELLEVVDDAGAALAALRVAARPGGVVSLLVTGRFGAVLSRTVAGRLAEARALLTDPDGRLGPTDLLRRRLDAVALRGLLAADGALACELLQGDGVLEGWVPGAVRHLGPAAGRAVADLEALAAAEPALLDMSLRLHAMARRTS